VGRVSPEAGVLDAANRRVEHGDLSIRNLSKTFPGQRALDSVSLDVHPGEIHALLGHNGSGKSTLIKIIAGFHQPDAGGEVFVAGEPLMFGAPQESLRAGLRFVHQNLGLVGRFSAVENIGLGGYTLKSGRRIDWDAQTMMAETLMTRLGFDFDLHKPLDECRAVERTAVAIARALDDRSGAMRFLVLDEPTAALPPAEVDHLFDLIREIANQNVGLIYVSHRLDEIEMLATRATVLRDGRLIGTYAMAGLQRRELVSILTGTEGHVAHERGDGPVADGNEVAYRVENLRTATIAGISFEIARGEILGVAGLAGSGREDLPTAAAAVEETVVDQLLIGAPPGSSTDAAEFAGALDAVEMRRCGVILALGNTRRDAAVRRFSVRENITLPVLARYRRSTRLQRTAERNASTKWIDELDIAPKDVECEFALLSGGNQQKVLIATALNQNPTVLVLDEPTAGVDIGARNAIYQLIREQAAGDVSFLIASSDIEDLISLCDRVLVLRDGVITDVLPRHRITKSDLLTAINHDPTGSVTND